MKSLFAILILSLFCQLSFAQDIGNLVITTDDIGEIQAINIEIRLAGPTNDWIAHRLVNQDGSNMTTPMSYVWANLNTGDYEVRATVWLDNCAGPLSEIVAKTVLPLKPLPPAPTLDVTTDGVPEVDPVVDCQNDPSCTLIELF